MLSLTECRNTQPRPGRMHTFASIANIIGDPTGHTQYFSGWYVLWLQRTLLFVSNQRHCLILVPKVAPTVHIGMKPWLVLYNIQCLLQPKRTYPTLKYGKMSTGRHQIRLKIRLSPKSGGSCHENAMPPNCRCSIAKQYHTSESDSLYELSQKKLSYEVLAQFDTIVSAFKTRSGYHPEKLKNLQDTIAGGRGPWKTEFKYFNHENNYNPPSNWRRCAHFDDFARETVHQATLSTGT